MAEKKRGPGRPPGSKNKNTKSAGGSSAKSKSAAAPKKDSVKKTVEPLDPKTKRLHDEIAAIVLMAIGVFLILALQTSVAGAVGEIVGGFLKGLFGFGALILPYFLILYAIFMLLGIAIPFRGKTVILLCLLFFAIDLVNAGRFVADMQFGVLGIGDVYHQGQALENGGVFGMYAGHGLYRLIGKAGLYIFAALLMIVCLLLLVDTPLSSFFEKGRERKLLRKERREATMELQRQEEEKKAQMQAEMDAMREVVNKAGRETRVDYHTPSSRADAFLSQMEQIEGKKEPAPVPAAPDRFRGEAPNRRQILNMVTDEELLNSKGPEKGHGLDPADAPDWLFKQEEPKGETWVIERKDATSDPEKWQLMFEGEAPERTIHTPYEEAPKTAETAPAQETAPAGYPGFLPDSKLNGQSSAPREEDMVSPGPSRPTGKEDFDIGGESVVTQASVTEQGDSDVSVSPVKRSRYKLPKTDLLNPPAPKSGRQLDRSALSQRADLLESTLASFGVEAKVVNVISGPSVTRYEIEPARGVKVSRITNLSDDLALNMRARSIRIEAPIPGKAAVGIEIENEDREMVGIREILESGEFRKHKSKLAFTVGRDIGGNSVVADIAKMPHMLIAGATGSGKSVCINSIIISLLYKARPEEVKLILVDPKQVELGNYNGIPHLLIPVVTDPSKAASALQWAVAEMNERYKKFAKNGVRDIGSYNSKMKGLQSPEEVLPQVVIIIDELADLMMVASAQVEEAICRLAQLARAAGMHLILATQRPSVDVITGLIKANVPSRIAFMVSSQIDSRTIIDMIGAEKLVGNGDMLFKPQDLNKPKRIQGPYVDDDEVERVIDFVKSQAEAQYSEEVIEHLEKGGNTGIDDSEDELLMDAIELVVERGQASTSMIQRQFRLGYNRAARIMDSLEAQGIIGPAEGSRPRPVLLTREALEQRKAADR